MEKPDTTTKKNKDDYLALGKMPEEVERLKKHYAKMTTPIQLEKHYSENKGNLTLSEIKQWLVWERMDTKIIPMVRKLNERGYRTSASCSGHKDHNGYVSFERRLTNLQITKIERIMEQLGIRGIEYERSDKMTRLSFVAL